MSARSRSLPWWQDCFALGHVLDKEPKMVTAFCLYCSFSVEPEPDDEARRFIEIITEQSEARAAAVIDDLFRHGIIVEPMW